MYFVLVDDQGTRLAGFYDEGSAIAAFREAVTSDRSAADELMLLTYDDAGEPAREARMYSDIEGSPARVVLYFMDTAVAVSSVMLDLRDRQLVPMSMPTGTIMPVHSVWPEPHPAVLPAAPPRVVGASSE